MKDEKKLRIPFVLCCYNVLLRWRCAITMTNGDGVCFLNGIGISCNQEFKVPLLPLPSDGFLFGDPECRTSTIQRRDGLLWTSYTRPQKYLVFNATMQEVDFLPFCVCYLRMQMQALCRAVEILITTSCSTSVNFFYRGLTEVFIASPFCDQWHEGQVKRNHLSWICREPRWMSSLNRELS